MPLLEVRPLMGGSAALTFAAAATAAMYYPPFRKIEGISSGGGLKEPTGSMTIETLYISRDLVILSPQETLLK